MNEVKENALDIEYVVEGVVHNSFATNPVAKDDNNTTKIQSLARTALRKGVSVSVPFTTTEKRRQAAAGNKVTQSTQNSQKSASNDIESETLDIFGIAFPWLFPGGIGGPFDIRTKKDAQNLDGRLHLL